LSQAIGFLFPLEPQLDRIELRLEAEKDTEITIELWDTGRAENYIPANEITKVIVPVKRGKHNWIDIPLEWKPEHPQNAFVIVRANPLIHLYLSAEPFFGVLGFESSISDNADFGQQDKAQKVMMWSMKGVNRRPFCMKVYPETKAYTADKIKDGYTRPYGGPHLWTSGVMKSNQEEAILLNWDRDVLISRIEISFNDDVNEDLINLHHHVTPFDTIPELVKDYRVEAWLNEEWVILMRETDNRKRKRIHRLDDSIITSQIRIAIETTNGSSHASVAEVRVYS
jgi:hypothetical protein